MSSQVSVPDLHAWRLLNHLESCPHTTQRGAARVLGVSVKVGHEVVSRLLERGWIHVHKHNSRRWDYLLTKDGLREKARLTVEFLEFSMQFYRQARRLSASLCRTLSEQGETQVSILGANELAEITCLGVQEWGLQVTKVYELEPEEGQRFMGIPVARLEEIPDVDGPPVIVCVYDAGAPMAHRFLPPTAPRSSCYRWIFT